MKSRSSKRRVRAHAHKRARIKADRPQPTVLGRGSSTLAERSAAQPTPDKKGVVAILADIQTMLGKDLADLQVQAARLTQIQDFIRIYVEPLQAKPTIESLNYVG